MNMDNETQNLKWWDQIFILIIILGIMSGLTYIGLNVFMGYSERVELRKLSITQANLNILKIKYEIMRLSCDKKGGKFIESSWNVECN